MFDPPDSDNWNGYIIHGEKLTIYVDNFFKDTGVVFTLKTDVLSMMTDYNFDKTDSPDAKQLSIFWMKCILMYIQKSKSLLDKNLIEIILIRELY